MNRLIRLLRNLFIQVLFKLKYPYLFGVRANSLRKIVIPFGNKIGRGTRLLVDNSMTIAEKHILIAKKVWIGENVEIHTWHNDQVIIHEGASIQDRCKILGSVEIGKNAILAPNIFISSGTHYAFEKPFELIRNQDKEVLSTTEGKLKHSKKVIIEEDVWIGTNCFIKAGITIGRGSVVGANSVINKDIPPYSTVVGVNKIIKNRLDFNPPLKINGLNKEHRPYFYSGFSSMSHLEAGKEAYIAIPETSKNIYLKLTAKVAGSIKINDKKEMVKVGENQYRISTDNSGLAHFNFKRVHLNSLVKVSIKEVEIVE